MQLDQDEIERRRRSGLRLDREGRFWHEGEVVRHPGLLAALWRWLDRLPDGRYVLRLDGERYAYLEVDGHPFQIRSLRWEGEQAIAVLSDGSEEPLDPTTLRLRGDEIEAQVKGGRFPARLAAPARGTLAERLLLDGDQWWLVVGDQRCRLVTDG